MQIHSIGIDLGKTTLHLGGVGSSRPGAVEEEVYLQKQLLAYTANLQTFR